MYAERRITEALDGPDMAALSAALGRRELDESIQRFADRPAMTKLRTHLEGIDPDECYSLVPYEKGAALLGSSSRPWAARSSTPTKDYFKRHEFQSITTRSSWPTSARTC
jgi:hypothetical protein